MKDDPDLVRGTIERQLANPAVQVDHHDRRHRHHVARQHLRGGLRPARQTARRLRRAVPDAELRADRRGRDDEPRLRRPGRRTHRGGAAGIGNAVRLAMERLLIPELGHLVQRGITVSSRIDASVHLDHLARGSPAPSHGGDPADRANRARGAGRCRRPRRRRRRDVAASTCRRSRDRRWTATPSSPPTPRARPATRRSGSRIVERIYTGQMPRGSIAPRPLRGNRHRRADARGRRRRGDGRGHGQPPAEPGTGDAVEIFAAAAPGQNIGRRGADITAGALVVTAGDLLTPGRVGVAGGDRPRRRRGLRTAARGDSVDRQRGRRARPAAGARPDLRRQPLHAGRHHRRARRRARARTAPSQDTIDALDDALDALRRRRRDRLLGRQLGRRARPDPRRRRARAAR